MSFLSYGAKNVTTSASSLRTIPASTVGTVIGCGFANTTAASVTIDVYVTRSAVDYYLIKGAVVAPYNSLVIIGADQKIILNAADILKIVANTVTCGDAWASILELAQ